nr:iron-containing alcohol dehydrogenase [Maliibacterium massiliense]
MLNFEFCHYTDMIFGKGTEAQVGQKIRQYGGTKVMLVYGGGSIKKSGLYDKVVAALGEAELPFVELSGVKPNPLLSLARKGLAIAKQEGVDFLLAVGGGSAIDTAKAIALGLVYEGDFWDYYSGKAEPTKMAPVGTVLTIAAAGSETSRSSVLTEDETLLKRGFMFAPCRPTFSIMNPEWTYTLPAYQTASGATDIFSHSFERYFMPDMKNELTDRFCEAVMKTVLRQTPIAIAQPDNYDARAELMLAGSFSHNDITGVGRGGMDGSCHGMEHELSAAYDVAHGAGLGVLMPAWMLYNYKRDPRRFVQLCARVFDVDVDTHYTDWVVQEGVRRFRSWLKRIGMPVTLYELGIKDDTRIDEMVQRARVTNPNGTMGNMFQLTKQDVKNIYLSVLK